MKLSKKRPKKRLSPKLRAFNLLTLRSMASGLRSMGRGGQVHLLKLIEEEIRVRQNEKKHP